MQHDYEQNIKCPYCGWEELDSWEFEGEYGVRECGLWECGRCEKEFNVAMNIEVTYATWRIECKDEEHKYKVDRYHIGTIKYLGGGVKEELPENEWKYYKVEVCEICEHKRFVKIPKEEYKGRDVIN